MPVTRQASDQNTVRGTSEGLSLLEMNNRADNMVNNTHVLEAEVAQLKAMLLKSNDTISQLQNLLKSQLSPVVCQNKQPTKICSASQSSPDVSKSISLDASTSTSDNISKSDSFGLQKTGSLSFVPQNKGPVLSIQRRNSNPAPECPIQRNHRRNSTPAHLSFHDTVTFSSSSVSKLKKKRGSIGHSMSESSAQPNSIYTKLQRRHSFENAMSIISSNRYSPLADLKEECDPLITCEQSPK